MGQQEIPSVSSLRDKAQKVGHLKKLSGKGILTAGTWRERFCMLVKSRLYFYESDDSPGTEKSAGFVNLEFFDTCTEASTRMARKATNVFVIGSTEKGFFESHSGRHYFAAETLPQMKEWVNAINVAMNHIRAKDKRSRNHSKDSSHPPGQKKEASKMKSKEDENTGGTGTLPRAGSGLNHVTKGRVKGPQGRRLPRKSLAKSLHPGDMKSDALDSLGDSDEDIVRDVRGRATSLSALEASSDTHPKTSVNAESKGTCKDADNEFWGNDGSMDCDSIDTLDNNTVYRYSSTDESLEDEDISLAHIDLSKCFRQSPVHSSSGSAGFTQNRTHSRTTNGSGNGFRGPPIRNSSVTPPPCVLRKFRREQMSNGINSGNKAAKEEDTDVVLQELSMNPCRTSSGSSLSTLTADTCSNGQLSRQVSYSSLQRPTRRMSAASEQKQRPDYTHRHSSSANASPLMNGSNIFNNSNNPHSFQHNGVGYNNINGEDPPGNRGRGFQMERNMYAIKKDLEIVKFEASQLNIDITTLRHDVGSVQENVATVRGTLDITRERVGRLNNQVVMIERQISSVIKEATTMREQAKKVLESAEIAKATHENMLVEVENVLGFLRQSASGYSCHLQHQHQRPHFQTNCCPSPLPLVPMSYYGSQQHPSPLRRKSKSKTPERTLDSESEIELLDESQPVEKQINRVSKSFHSNSSSGSNNSNRASVIELSEHGKPVNEFKRQEENTAVKEGKMVARV